MFEKGINASTVSVPHACSRGSRVNALTELGKRRIPRTGTVLAVVMVNRHPQNRLLVSSILVIRPYLCLHTCLRPGWRQQCSLLMYMGRPRTTCLQRSTPATVPRQDRRRVTHAHRITLLSILRLTSHNRTSRPSDMTPPHRRVPRVAPRKEMRVWTCNCVFVALYAITIEFGCIWGVIMVVGVAIYLLSTTDRT